MAHEWAFYVAGDGEVAARTNNRLGLYDLLQLRDPQGWMTDSLIDYGVTAHGGVRNNLTNGVLWIPPAVVKLGKDGDDNAFDASLGAELGLARHLDDALVVFPQNANVLLFPVNTADTHWSLVAFYAADRTFVHYDSLGRSNDTAANALLAKLLARGYLSQARNFTRPAEVVPQADGYNCGLYVTQFARKIFETGVKLTGVEIGAITSQTSDTLRGDMLTALEPLFPPAPIGAVVPVLGGASKSVRPTRKVKPVKKGKKDEILKKSFWDSKGKRKDKIKAAVLLATNNDRPFTKCFIHTSPNATAVIEGTMSESLMTLTEEAFILWGALGESIHVPAPRLTKDGKFLSKYSTYAEKKGFSLAPQVLPDQSAAFDLDRSKNVIYEVTDEGYQPTFFQFQRQEMNTIMAHYERSVPDFHHNHQHIARSLILGVAMARFYIVNGQPRFLPGDTRPKERQKNPPDADGEREAALAEMPEPAVDEVDVAAVAFGIAMHDSARASSGKDVWEHESARNAFYYLKALGYGSAYAGYIARMIVKNEDNVEDRKSKGEDTTVEKLVIEKTVSVSRTSAVSDKKVKNTARKDDQQEPRLPDLNEQIVHDADTLEIHRVLGRRPFEPARFLFLTDGRVDRVAPKDASGARAALIADAALFVELTEKIAVEPEDGVDGKPGGPGRAHFEDILNDYRAMTGGFGGYLEAHESVIIEAIVQKPKSFPFLYQYYFYGCFDPKDAQFTSLTPEERLSLVRTRTHAIERLSRDHQRASDALEAFNADKNTNHDLGQFANDLVQMELTVNLCCDDLVKVMGGVEQDNTSDKYLTPAHLSQFWEIFFKANKTRTGASTNSGDRDHAELVKVQYQTPCESKRFERARRPKYAAVNLARTSAGACPKYGDALYVLKPHLWRRITLTHNDTFNVGVFPDDLCSPTHPFTLMRKISDMRFGETHLKLYAAGKGDKDAQGFRKAAQGGAAIPYVEVHIHGLVTWADDVEEIRISVNPKDRDAYKDEETPWSWVNFDRDVAAFAALWVTKGRPGGIPVRFVNNKDFDVYATRADALASLNPLSSTALVGKLSAPTTMKK